MADIFTKEKRSEIMSKIKSKNTNLETSFYRLISKKLYPKGWRYRKHYKKLIGRPDLVFVSKKVAVFIDGDFWHGYHFKKTKHRLPKAYWLEKIRNNIKRDKKVSKQLKKNGWTVVRIWETEIRERPDVALAKIIHALISQKQ